MPKVCVVSCHVIVVFGGDVCSADVPNSLCHVMSCCVSRRFQRLMCVRSVFYVMSYVFVFGLEKFTALVCQTLCHVASCRAVFGGGRLQRLMRLKSVLCHVVCFYVWTGEVHSTCVPNSVSCRVVSCCVWRRKVAALDAPKVCVMSCRVVCLEETFAALICLILCHVMSCRVVLCFEEKVAALDSSVLCYVVSFCVLTGEVCSAGVPNCVPCRVVSYHVVFGGEGLEGKGAELMCQSLFCVVLLL